LALNFTSYGKQLSVLLSSIKMALQSRKDATSKFHDNFKFQGPTRCISECNTV